MPAITPEERHVMEHATAWNHVRRLYRNRYVIGPDCDTWPTLVSLCERGLMCVRCTGSLRLGGMEVFAVTDAGLKALEEAQ